MVDSIILSLPDDIATSVREIANRTNQSIEEVVLSHLKRLSTPLPSLQPDIQQELSALENLSDDTLWTIARDQMPDPIQSRAQELMNKNNTGKLSPAEQEELTTLVDRADRLMLRKAEAASILRQRGHDFTRQDFQRSND